MRICRVPLTLVILGFIAFLLNGCVEMKKPEIKFVGQAIQSIDLEKIKLNLNFEVSNPNDLGADSAFCSYVVSVKNVECFKGDAIPFSLPGKKTTSLVLPVEIHYIKVFKTALAILQSVMAGEKELPYQVDGSISSSIMGIPISIPFSNQGSLPMPR